MYGPIDPYGPFVQPYPSISRPYGYGAPSTRRPYAAAGTLATPSHFPGPDPEALKKVHQMEQEARQSNQEVQRKLSEYHHQLQQINEQSYHSYLQAAEQAEAQALQQLQKDDEEYRQQIAKIQAANQAAAAKTAAELDAAQAAAEAHTHAALEKVRAMEEQSWMQAEAKVEQILHTAPIEHEPIVAGPLPVDDIYYPPEPYPAATYVPRADRSYRSQSLAVQPTAYPVGPSVRRIRAPSALSVPPEGIYPAGTAARYGTGYSAAASTQRYTSAASVDYTGAYARTHAHPADDYRPPSARAQSTVTPAVRSSYSGYRGPVRYSSGTSSITPPARSRA